MQPIELKERIHEFFYDQKCQKLNLQIRDLRTKVMKLIFLDKSLFVIFILRIYDTCIY